MTQKPQLDPAIYARHFETLRDGQDILEELTRRFALPAKRTGGIDGILETYHRAGATSVVQFIVSRINQANGINDHDDHDDE